MYTMIQQVPNDVLQAYTAIWSDSQVDLIRQHHIFGSSKPDRCRVTDQE